MSRITISRFCRDRAVFDFLRTEVLAELERVARNRGDGRLRCWSAGCGSGEEAYTLAMLGADARHDRPSFPRLTVVATDVDGFLLDRARRGIYPASSVKELPPRWWSRGYVRTRGEEYEVREELREAVHFVRQDLRRNAPEGSFHLICCRNLAFTYFEACVQRAVAAVLAARLSPGGALVLGAHESMPEATAGFQAWRSGMAVYRRLSRTAHAGP